MNFEQKYDIFDIICLTKGCQNYEDAAYTVELAEPQTFEEFKSNFIAKDEPPCEGCLQHNFEIALAIFIPFAS